MPTWAWVVISQEVFSMNPIAEELNEIIVKGNPYVYEMLSGIGRQLFFPRGILSQGAEAKEKGYRINATIGIAKEKGRTMCLPSIMEAIDGIAPEQSLTYAPSFGISALRKAWRDGLYMKNPSLEGKHISLPVVTCGVTHAISTFADLWVNPGDVVIIPDMTWGNYNMILNVRKGARITQYPAFSGNGGYDIPAFEKKVRQEADACDKIIVLLNFPHNPSGYSITVEEGDRMAEILRGVAAGGTKIIVATDDSYFGLFYEDDTLKESLFACLCEADERLLAVKLDGATKENFVWGLRVGFLTYGCRLKETDGSFYEALERKTAGCIRGNISNASHLSQSIVLRSLQDGRHQEEKKEKFEILRRRALRVKEVLKDPKYNDAWDVYPFNSGYFMCIGLKTLNAETLRLHLLNQYGVGLISLGEKNVRIAFSCLEEDEIADLFDIILQGIRDLGG